MTSTISTDHLANVPHPAGATSVTDWDDGVPTERYFRASKSIVDRADDPNLDGDIAVEIWGVQTADGEVRRHVDVLEGRYERLTMSSAGHARAFGEALIAAADEMEQMST
jgi:hypothetical protein